LVSKLVLPELELHLVLAFKLFLHSSLATRFDLIYFFFTSSLVSSSESIVQFYLVRLPSYFFSDFLGDGLLEEEEDIEI